MRPRVTTLLAAHGQHARYLRLTSRRQTNRFLHQLSTSQGDP
ncbi:hypothetical protein [Rugosimonospora africana]|nr:hypothetical protein [Rugosimonospora africana]